MTTADRSDSEGPFGFPGPVEIIAHRGFSARAPENTWAALDAGLSAGADAVEFDLHPASDGTPYLLHDETLDRTTSGTGPVHLHTPAELDTLDAGSWFDPAFVGEPIPSLASVMTSLRGRVGRIYAEVKRTRPGDDMSSVVEAVQKAGLFEHIVFISMDWGALDQIRSLQPGARIGYIVEARSRVDEARERAKDDSDAMLDFDARVLLGDPRIAERCREVDIALACWTVNARSVAQSMLDMGVPRITTNEVADLLEWKESLKPTSPENAR
jgi:glycerophosphoryl diester phosphodiesterase